MKALKVGDLPDQIGSNNRSFLYCTACGARYSANRGDYFLRPEDYVFKHCRRNMVLATSREEITIESS